MNNIRVIIAVLLRLSCVVGHVSGEGEVRLSRQSSPPQPSRMCRFCCDWPYLHSPVYGVYDVLMYHKTSDSFFLSLHIFT